MKYTSDIKDIKLFLRNNTHDYDEKTKATSPMYTVSLFSSDTALQSSPMNNASKSSSLRRIGTIKLLILAIVFPIMLLTIVNPMWICVFMKYPHVHRVPANVEAPHEENNVSPQSHTHSKLYKGGVKVTKETFDIIVESKDRIEELETTITVIENIPPNSENQRHDTTNKKETTNAKINKTPKADNSESVMDRIRERVFRDRTSCAYLALSVILLCAATVCSILCLTSSENKMYDDIENNYVRVDCDDDDKTNVTEKSNENNVAENKNCKSEC